MAHINLLPWREEFRQEKKKEFVTYLAFVVIVAGVCAYMWISFVDGQIKSQGERNAILNTEIQSLAKRVKEIEALKERRQELIDRMQVIQDLEGKRSVIVHYFDEFARAVPDGIYVKNLERKGNVLVIDGVSESNNRISAFMRKLNSSEWFTSPNLKSVVASPEAGEQTGKFSMELRMTLPDSQKGGTE